jgi:hypothetical protein
MSSYYMKVSRLDYYTWKVGAIILLIIMIALIGFNSRIQANYNAMVKDNFYHIGYLDCERYFNLTSDEQYVLNKYRTEQIELKENLK